MNEFPIVEYEGLRVLTSSQIADAYETDSNTLNKNFNRNKERYIEGKHYICLTGDDLRDFRAKGQIDVLPNTNKLYLWTEKGALLHAKSLNTDKAWEVYDRLVENYFRVREITSDLSPQMKMLYGMLDQMAQAERQANEAKRIADTAKETASKAIESVENIKEAVKPVSDNWRADINSKFNRIQRNADKQFNILRTEMYSELEHRAGCDLGKRLRNLKDRMTDNGCKKSDVDKLNKMDVIEQDKKLREIFSKIVTEYEIKYCA